MIFDPDDEEHEKIEYIFAVGWDRRIYIWADEKTEVVETYKMLPLNSKINEVKKARLTLNPQLKFFKTIILKQHTLKQFKFDNIKSALSASPT